VRTHGGGELGLTSFEFSEQVLDDDDEAEDDRVRLCLSMSE